MPKKRKRVTEGVTAFVDRVTEEPQQGGEDVKQISLTVRDGSIDFSEISDDTKADLISGMIDDPDAKAAFGASAPLPEPTGPIVADSSVLACANALMSIEVLGILTLGKRAVPVLKVLPAPVVVKACFVTREEIEPILEPSKRLIAKYSPAELLQHQDLVVVAEHLLKLGALKFQECVKMAIEVQQHLNASTIEAQPINGREQQSKQETVSPPPPNPQGWIDTDKSK